MECTQLFLSQQLNTQLFLSQAVNHSIIQVNAAERFPFLAVQSKAATRAMFWAQLVLLESGKFVIIIMSLWMISELSEWEILLSLFYHPHQNDLLDLHVLLPAMQSR